MSVTYTANVQTTESITLPTEDQTIEELIEMNHKMDLIMARLLVASIRYADTDEKAEKIMLDFVESLNK